VELDYTQLSLFGMCPAKYKYTYRDQLEDVVGNAAHFSSELIHPALSSWYKGEENQWEHWWEKYTAAAPNPGDDLYTLPRAEEIYDEYTELYKSDKEEYEVITTEVSGVTPVGYVWDRNYFKAPPGTHSNPNLSASHLFATLDK